MYDFNKIEEEVLEFWKKNKIYEGIKDRNKKGKKFYFLQGPPYTSGRLHMGHAWNNALKDAILRYKRMKGLNVWDRGGFDMHGLPTEHKVQEKFNLKDKKAIENFGIDKFTKECKEFSLKMAELMTKDLERFGIWMDHKNAYMPINNAYIEGVWWFIKKAHEANRLYEGEKSMTWCYSCETALAKHELEYQNIKDKSIFIKLKIKGKKNEYLIVWTTTPWTIPFNLGVMVNPKLDYVKAKVKNEIWIVAKGLAGPVVQNIADEKLDILEEFKGDKLKGIKYEQPFYEDIKEVYNKVSEGHDKTFSVVLSDKYVDLSAGTGLVHMAPGCGPEDFEVGKENNILPFNNLTEKGEFPKEMGKYAGLHAKRDNDKFIEALDKKGVLIATTEVEHEYAHCARCRSPVIYKTTKQWFIKIEDLVQRMLKDIPKIKWVPKEGEKWYENWIKNLKDNSITRQRYWGTPIPLWKCKTCKDFTIIGSVKELKKLTGKVPDDLHKPWIDKIKIKCKCGGEKERLLDVLDVWIDPGTASWNCLDYPSREDLLKKFWPADLVLEATEQTRLWFYMLHECSTIAFNEPCFKNVFMHGMLMDVEGVKMSKSLGNIISPYEIVDKYGADIMRYYTIVVKAGENMNFSWKEIENKQKNLIVLYNTVNYLLNYADPSIKNIKGSNKEVEDKYILSRLNSTIKEVSELMENYQLDRAPLKVESLFLELSRTYIQLTRNRSKDKVVLHNTYNVLLDILKMFSPTAPFLTEHLYQKLKEAFDIKEKSIHEFSWPKAKESLIKKDLEEKFDIVKPIIQEILSQREKISLGVRWPLSKVTIQTSDKKIEDAVKKLGSIIKTQTNIKAVETKKTNEKLVIILDKTITKELEMEGYSREIMRRIQALRKKAGLKQEDEIELRINSDYDLSKFKKEIMEKVGAKILEFSMTKENYMYSSKEKIKDNIFTIVFDKL